MKREASRSRSILFQLPIESMNSSSAVNIWTQNMAQAFTEAGIKSTIQFLSKNHIEPHTKNGVQYRGLPILHEWLLKTPIVKRQIVPIIQNYSLRFFKNTNGFVCALRGPFQIETEKRKLKAVKKSGMIYLHSIMEHPSVIQEENVSYYLRTMANEYDILMPITTRLRNLYLEHGRTKPIFVNPIVAKMQPINTMNHKESDELQVLMYAGNLMHKEEILILLKSFAIINNIRKETQLQIFGGGTSELVREYNSMCINLQIIGSVKFMGKIKHSEVLKQYRKAKLLLLPRPFKEYSRSGFPSKLGEYLVAGKAVVTTGTGDIPIYLKDNESAYIVSEATPEAYAMRVIDALCDTNRRKIGINGYLVAEKHFSIRATAIRIRNFINEYEKEYLKISEIDI